MLPVSAVVQLSTIYRILSRLAEYERDVILHGVQSIDGKVDSLLAEFVWGRQLLRSKILSEGHT